MDIERLIHSTKAAIATTLGVLLIYVLGVPADQWVVITIIVVMCAQIYVGSVIQKAYLRFLGTLIGCIFASITLVGFGVTSKSIVISIGLSVFIFSYLATGQEKLTYAGTLGAVTTAIIMLGQHPSLMFAAQRFLEISTGIFIATIVSQFILPIHASAHLRRAQAKTLIQLRDYYLQSFQENQNNEMLDYQELDENIVKSMLVQRQLAKESASEPIKSFFDIEHFMKTLYCEKQMLRSITFMRSAFTHFENEKIILNSFMDSSFSQSFLQALNTLIKCINDESDTKNNCIYIPPIHLLHQDPIITPHENAFYVKGFIFSAEILLNSLTDLVDLYKIPRKELV